MNDNYIIFTVAGTSYALPSQSVAHIEMIEEVTRVPNAPPFVDGVVFSRGEVVPAVSLRARFGFERAPFDTRTRLLVVRPSGRLIGLVADAAREFLTIPDAAIRPPHEGLSGLSGRYLRGIAAIGDRMIVILDLEAILDVDQGAVVASSEFASQQSQESR
jgi:chemotaxis signal transduction protein